jgi:hypothetical protein
MPRDLDAILVEAVKLIDPPADSVDLFQATLATTISTVRGIHEKTANLPSPAEMKSDVADYLEALRVARKKAYAVAPFYWSKAYGRDDPGRDRADRVPPPPYNFVEALDREIREVEARASFPVPYSAKPRDSTADMAANAACGLLEARFIFPKDRDDKDLHLPAVKNPWRQDAPLTKGGRWPMLAALIYKAVTGRDNHHDMMPACRQVRAEQRLARRAARERAVKLKTVLRLPYSATRRPRRPKSRRV